METLRLQNRSTAYAMKHRPPLVFKYYDHTKDTGLEGAFQQQLTCTVLDQSRGIAQSNWPAFHTMTPTRSLLFLSLPKPLPYLGQASRRPPHPS